MAICNSFSENCLFIFFAVSPIFLLLFFVIIYNYIFISCCYYIITYIFWKFSVLHGSILAYGKKLWGQAPTVAWCETNSPLPIGNYMSFYTTPFPFFENCLIGWGRLHQCCQDYKLDPGVFCAPHQPFTCPCFLATCDTFASPLRCSQHIYALSSPCLVLKGIHKFMHLKRLEERERWCLIWCPYVECFQSQGTKKKEWVLSIDI